MDEIAGLEDAAPHEAGEGLLDEGPNAAGDREVAIRPRTDLGNAERFRHLYGPDVRWCGEWKSWLIWTGACWEVDKTEAARRWAAITARRIKEEIPILQLAYLEQMEEAGVPAEPGELEAIEKQVMAHARQTENTARLTAMLREAQALGGIPAPVDSLDRDRMLLNVANGTLDLERFLLRPPRRSDLITRASSVPFEPSAKCPRWLQFLSTVFCGDDELIAFMQRACGVAMTGDVSDQVLIVLHGDGSNGKSTLVETLMRILGPYAVACPAGMLMATAHERHPTELARLRGARFASVMETREGIRLDEPLVKQLTGGDTITARYMNRDFFEFEPQHTLMMATNHKPRIRGTDYGIWRRLRLVPFEAEIKDKDRHLIDKLTAEAPGILNWMLEGCRAWQRDGLGSATAIDDATEVYRQDMDLIGLWMEDCLDVGPECRLTNADLYKSYREWCSANGHTPMASTELGKRLGERGFADYRTKYERGRAGLALRSGFHAQGAQR